MADLNLLVEKTLDRILVRMVVFICGQSYVVEVGMHNDDMDFDDIELTSEDVRDLETLSAFDL